MCALQIRIQKSTQISTQSSSIETADDDTQPSSIKSADGNLTIFIPEGALRTEDKDVSVFLHEAKGSFKLPAGFQNC